MLEPWESGCVVVGGGVGCLLSVAGVYGLLSRHVQRRKKKEEIRYPDGKDQMYPKGSQPP